jgi:hypothetical protein
MSATVNLQPYSSKKATTLLQKTPSFFENYQATKLTQDAFTPTNTKYRDGTGSAGEDLFQSFLATKLLVLPAEQQNYITIYLKRFLNSDNASINLTQLRQHLKLQSQKSEGCSSMEWEIITILNLFELTHQPWGTTHSTFIG